MHGSLVRSLFLGSVLWEQPLLISRLPILYGGVWGSIVCVWGGCLLCSHRKIHPSRWSLLSPEDTEGFMRWEGALLAPLAQ